DHPRAVYDPAQWRHFALHATQQLGNLIRIGYIDGKFVNRSAVLPQARERGDGIRRGHLAAPDDSEMTSPLPDKPLSGRKAEPAAPPSDEITGRGRQLHSGFGSAWGDRRTIGPVHRHHEFADMP